MSNESSLEQRVTAKKRAKQVFRFLRAYSELRNPVIRDVSDYNWSYMLDDLPAHDLVRMADPSQHTGNEVDEVAESWSPKFELRVGRAEVTPTPTPPEILSGWLKEGWSDPCKPPDILKERHVSSGKGDEVVRFDDSEERRSAFIQWIEEWNAWADREAPAHEARELFRALYDLHSKLKNESHDTELMLGDGVLVWESPNGLIYHPLLLRRVEITFDPDAPAIIITESEDETQLYENLLRDLAGLDQRAVNTLIDQHGLDELHPLAKGTTDRFLAALAHTISEHASYDDTAPPTPTHAPIIGRAGCLFLRRCRTDLARVIDSVLERIEDAPPPRPLQDILGIERSGQDSEPRTVDSSPALFCKPANAEQRQVLKRLDRHDSVVVQGPPGTGKTQTIANIVGHLTAQGQNVLVTSHTANALRQVREHLPQAIQRLCVRLLGSDKKSKAELEAVISEITHQMGVHEVQDLQTDAAALASQRSEVLQGIEDLRDELKTAFLAEYEELIVDGQPFTPTEAAFLLAEKRKEHGWIEGQANTDASLPLTKDEIRDLYQLNRKLSLSDERALRKGLPDPDRLPAPATLRSWLEACQELSNAPPPRSIYWTKEEGATCDGLEELNGQLKTAIAAVRDLSEWEMQAVIAGFDENSSHVWQKVLYLISTLSRLKGKWNESLIRNAPELADDVPLKLQLRALEHIVGHLEERPAVSPLWVKINGWSDLIDRWETKEGNPTTKESFVSLMRQAILDSLREQLIALWERLVTAHDGATVWETSNPVETVLEQYADTIENHLRWHRDHWQPLVWKLRDAGLDWGAIERAMPTISGPAGALKRLVATAQIAQEELKRMFDQRKHRELLDQHDSRCQSLADLLEGKSSLACNLLNLCKEGNVEAYEECYAEIRRLHELRPAFDRRIQLLDNLRAVAPGWAGEIEDRSSPHDRHAPPSDPVKAWQWRVSWDALEEKVAVSLDELQTSLERKMNKLRKITLRLIEKLAWAAQIDRVTRDQEKRQALIGWADTQRKIGKGYGKNVPRLRREARRLMQTCRSAVPVWIAPLTRVLETFDPGDTRFDVAIIDEASQVDIIGLILLYMADKVIVVGDHKQVSPLAVGEQSGVVNRLIDEHLVDTPNAHLYDGKTSVYDLARQSFAGCVRLREHFRSVPEIIEFSNTLSYNGEIIPLRDSTGVRLWPHVVEHQVTGARCSEKVNKKEAQHVVSLVVAATQQHSYRDASIGVISMVGDAQAEYIEELLHQRLDPETFQKHDIMVGNAAQFQGAERDVVFLSLVDTPDAASASSGSPGNPQKLPLRSRSLFEQRFNVAVSRARDQVWVVHSLQPDRDLQVGDLRRQLIEHARHPTNQKQNVKAPRQDTPDLIQEVKQELEAQGFEIVPHWCVGAYQIDLVVLGRNGKKLAVSCDGAHTHRLLTPEKLLERQVVLQRMGWSFARVRGSLFYRDAKRALQPVLQRLRAQGIVAREPARSSLDVAHVSRNSAKDLKNEADNLFMRWWPDRGEPMDVGGDGQVGETDLQVNHAP